MKAHREYVGRLAVEGRLVLTGVSPGPVDVYGILIVEVRSAADASRLMAEDPFVASGMMKADLRPFRTVLGRDTQ